MIIEIIVWIVLSVVVGFLGDGRRVGFAGGFFWSLLLSPLIGFAIVMASRRKGDFEEELARVQGVERGPKGPPPPAMKAGEVDVVAGLARLKELHESGALSDDEYRKAKERLLG